MYPTKKQSAILRRWFGTTRATYNWCVDAIRGGTKASAKDLRAQCMNKDAGIPEWAFEVPFDVRDTAVRDVMWANQNGWAKWRKTGEHFKLKLRSRKDPQQTIDVLKKHWNTHKRGAFAAIFRANKLRQAPGDRWHIPDKLYADSKLTLDRLGRYYLCIPMPIEKKRGENQASRLPVAAIDPGARTFATVYTGERVMQWGEGSMTRIMGICHMVDKLVSRRNQTTVLHRERYRLTRAILRGHAKIKALVSELHRKLARWLVENVDRVLLPTFETQQMVARRFRRIGSKTARAMCTLSHFRFRQHLMSIARSSQCEVTLVCEAHTSKTCGQCGRLHHGLGGSKTFRCPSCGIVCDRDANGARNILLRYLTRMHACVSPLV